MKTTRFLSLVLIFITAFLTACGGGDEFDSIFRYDIPSNPTNLDPQSADDVQSYLIIENTFEGLLRVADDGKLTEGVATDYTVSDDGLTYTFLLREDAKWTDTIGFDELVTAHDFVFAFKRLFLPETSAPNASKLFCIKNSEGIRRGLISADELGVRADGNFNLIIELEYANAMLPSLLATAPCMPCNEEYFYATKGRYGLEADYTPSNGAFYVKSWNYDPWSDINNNVILRRNESYSLRRQVYPRGITLRITRDTSTYESRFIDDSSDFIITSGTKASDLMSKGYNMVGYESITWGLSFNLSEPIVKNQSFRLALSYSVDRDAYKGYLPQGINTARAIIAPDVTMLDTSYREVVGQDIALEFNAKTAMEMYEQAKEQLGLITIKPISIIMPKSISHIDYFSFVTQTWQKELGFFCVLEQLEEDEYKRRISAGDYTAAIVEVTGDYNSPESFLTAFRSTVDTNKTGYKNSEYDSLIRQASVEKTLSGASELYLKAEKMLIDNAVFIPLYYQTEYLAQAHGVFDAAYNPFTNAIKFDNVKILD